MNTTIHHILQEPELSMMPASDNEAILITGRIIGQLQGYMRLYTFRNQAEEILYFKVFKQWFLAHCMNAESVLKKSNQHPWAEHMIEHQQFYEYYTSGTTNRDSFYFTTQGCKVLDFVLVSDFGLVTDYDHWVARILASEWAGKQKH
jgi:hypothetical protein